LRALGGVANILMLMTANLVGFVIGLEGIQYLIGELTGSTSGMFPLYRAGGKCSQETTGIGFLVVACVCLFIGVQFMLEYREEEKRRGIYRKY